MACSTERLTVVVEAEMKKHIVNVQEVHIVEVLVPTKHLGGFPN